MSSGDVSEQSRRFCVLSWEQVRRLDAILGESVPIHGRGNFPTLSVQPRQIVQVVRARLEERGIAVRDVKLNGSAASHVLHQDTGLGYKDLDLIFGLTLADDRAFRLVKDVVLDCLLDFLPPGVSRERLSPLTLKEAYVQKLVKVCNDTDRWSLISLSNNTGKNVELKFTPMSESFHPTVLGESVYGDFHEALGHLRRRTIATRSPEEIRGGGLLKYCHLLQRKLEAYLQNHFSGMEHKRYECLATLHRVVNESTVCLMGHERRQTLGLISALALRVLAEQNTLPTVTNVTCYYQPAPYVRDVNFSNYYVARVQPHTPLCGSSFQSWQPCN
ncbi:hypothetical protein AAFF_G00174940 [Aldrovandia affinis]|uniref:Terminal nucleotidyltransferase 5B n=1 Tax=Aldrovandia affinis TaxID=143900 RepID=A0AAD7RLH5_9TELE|nr:hypothetical protein AAFF_G00174940 [Aldrovandia affinis]